MPPALAIDYASPSSIESKKNNRGRVIVISLAAILLPFCLISLLLPQIDRSK
jgi:hypothetical protein